MLSKEGESQNCPVLYFSHFFLLLLEAILLTYFIAMFPFGVVEWMYAGF